jgi:hypothetical protein
MFEQRLWMFKAFNALAGLITFLLIFGVLKSRPAYFVYANTAVKCFLAACLIWRFGISKKTKLSEFDRHACFVAGSYILLSSFAEYSHYIKGFFWHK